MGQLAMPGDEAVGQIRTSAGETRADDRNPAPASAARPAPNERKTASAPLKTRPSGSMNLTARSKCCARNFRKTRRRFLQRLRNRPRSPVSSRQRAIQSLQKSQSPSKTRSGFEGGLAT